MNKRLLGTITALSILSLAAPAAFAQQAVVTPIERFIGICAGGGQLCDPPFSFAVETGSDLVVAYAVPSSHCSSHRLHLFMDGALVRSTGFLGWDGAPPPFDTLPIETGPIDLGPLTPGAHVLEIQAEGQTSGCNRGSLNSWAGSLTITASTLEFDEAIEAMGRLADFVEAMEIPAGFGGNLSAPLAAAIGLLTDGNARNDMGACGALTGFRDEVQHHLLLWLPNEAARLTQQPDVIAASLGCR